MKVLWVSNRLFNDIDDVQSGTWLKPLAVKLQTEDLQLANISFGNVKTLSQCNYQDIMQWAFPKSKLDYRGSPSRKTRLYFKQVLDAFKPDIIQVWGSENFLGVLPFDEGIIGIKVLTMQGVLGSMYSVTLAGLTAKDIISTIGITEILCIRKSIFSERKMFFRRSKVENLMLYKSQFIITQSEWTESQIMEKFPSKHFYRTHIALRSEFLKCKKWHKLSAERNKPILFTSCVGYSLKGLHTLIHAASIIKQYYPDIVIRIAGNIGRQDFLGNGYMRFIKKLISRYGMENNISWMGLLNVSQVVENLQEASVYINPSFVESYSLAFAEALSVGTPCVVSYAGAMPELAQDNTEALFFPKGDYQRCAYQVCKLLKDEYLSNTISLNATKRADSRNIEFDIVKEQLIIYENILLASSSNINE